jgi:hypothetical protein
VNGVVDFILEWEEGAAGGDAGVDDLQVQIPSLNYCEFETREGISGCM